MDESIVFQLENDIKETQLKREIIERLTTLLGIYTYKESKKISNCAKIRRLKEMIDEMRL